MFVLGQLNDRNCNKCSNWKCNFPFIEKLKQIIAESTLSITRFLRPNGHFIFGKPTRFYSLKFHGYFLYKAQSSGRPTSHNFVVVVSVVYHTMNVMVPYTIVRQPATTISRDLSFKGTVQDICSMIFDNCSQMVRTMAIWSVV